MSAKIDARAIVDSKAKIASGVVIEPYAVIGAGVEIGEGTWIGSHVIIKGSTSIGKNNKIFQFSSIGEEPQDLKYRGGNTRLEIGDHNIIRECCTINRGTEVGGGLTKIGNHNLIMAYTHIAHDCDLKDHIIIATHVSLAGHAIVDHHVILSGFTGVHQFCHIGAYSFSAASSMIPKDVLPFTKVSGYYAKPFGLNSVGLQRHKFSEKVIAELKNAYKIIYRQDNTVTEAIVKLKSDYGNCAEVQTMVRALEQAERGIVR